MQNFDIKNINFSTSEGRWARLGPYYAMFPLDFAFQIVNEYSQEGDYIIDPFAGRCSSIYAGAVLGRKSLGIEINPIGWLYGSIKLKPANKEDVIQRLGEIYKKRSRYNRQVQKLPEFFTYCYCEDVLKFLLAVRDNLAWEENHIDATLMAILLVYLHGKLGQALSNQMRQTKSMGDSYSVKWWKAHNKYNRPPEINPYDFILDKIHWRYAKGVPNVAESQVILGDSSIELKKIIQTSQGHNQKYSLLFTSPPYWSITNYHVDQWLRLWLLGGSVKPKAIGEEYKGRFNSKVLYERLLFTVFSDCAKVMKDNSTIYVRTDAREFTNVTTLNVLKQCFPAHKVSTQLKPYKKKTQTELFGDKSKKLGEVDIILTAN